MKAELKEQLKQECIDCIAKAGEEELKIVYRKNKRRDTSMVIVCIVAIIAIGVEVPFLHWWSILSGILTIAVPFIFYWYYCYID